MWLCKAISGSLYGITSDEWCLLALFFLISCMAPWKYLSCDGSSPSALRLYKSSINLQFHLLFRDQRYTLVNETDDFGIHMLPPRPKLTRRKGACKLCRKRRIRCESGSQEIVQFLRRGHRQWGEALQPMRSILKDQFFFFEPSLLYYSEVHALVNMSIPIMHSVASKGDLRRTGSRIHWLEKWHPFCPVKMIHLKSLSIRWRTFRQTL